MSGWTHAARMVNAGFSEAECNGLCGWMLGHVNHDKARGFCAGVLSGYHEIAEGHTVLATLGGSR